MMGSSFRGHVYGEHRSTGKRLTKDRELAGRALAVRGKLCEMHGRVVTKGVQVRSWRRQNSKDQMAVLGVHSDKWSGDGAQDVESKLGK